MKLIKSDGKNMLEYTYKGKTKYVEVAFDNLTQTEEKLFNLIVQLLEEVKEEVAQVKLEIQQLKVQKEAP